MTTIQFTPISLNRTPKSPSNNTFMRTGTITSPISPVKRFIKHEISKTISNTQTQTRIQTTRTQTQTQTQSRLSNQYQSPVRINTQSIFREGTPVANRRGQRRSRSAETWLDHRPRNLTKPGMIIMSFTHIS